MYQAISEKEKFDSQKDGQFRVQHFSALRSPSFERRPLELSNNSSLFHLLIK